MSMGKTCDYCGVWMRGNRACSASDSKRACLEELIRCGNTSPEQRREAREEYIQRYLS